MLIASKIVEVVENLILEVGDLWGIGDDFAK
jgi:hypothetical protein